jgi:hypothetical protein
MLIDWLIERHPHGEFQMRKTQVHTWIAMFFCVLAVAAEALKTGAIHLPF